MVPGAHVYKNIAGQVIGKTTEGFLVKTGDTVLEIIEYSYEDRIKIGDRLKNHE
jgi:methionyl-tRNA formyltransferase